MWQKLNSDANEFKGLQISSSIAYTLVLLVSLCLLFLCMPWCVGLISLIADELLLYGSVWAEYIEWNNPLLKWSIILD